MINKDSIVTAYDEHLTLVEWLQKVENALNNAVLTNLGIAKLNDKNNVATYQVTATFADNTTIVSDTFTLPSTDIVTAFGNLTTLVNGFDTRINHNTADIANLESRTKNLEDTKVVVNTGIFDPTSDNPAGQKSVYNMPIQFENIIDKEGHKRFQEWDISDLSTGLDITYSKVTLSGSHLMAVVSGINNTENAITLPNRMFNATLPTWLLEKLYAPNGNNTDSRDISAHNLKVFSSVWDEATSYLTIVHITPSSNSFTMQTGAVISVPANSYIRLQVDLIIN